MYICSQNLLSMSLSEYSVIKREFNGNRSIPSKFMLDIEYSNITSDIIKSFDCICIMAQSFCTKNELNHSVLYVFTCTVYLILF